MSQDRFLELLSLKLSGEARPEELAELEAFIADNPEQGFRSEIMDQIWKSEYKGQPINKKEAFNRHMQRLSNHLSEPVLQYETPEPEEEIAVEEEEPRRRVFTLGRVIWATGIAASILLGVFVYQKFTSNTPKKPIAQIVSTKRGSKTTNVTLPDGTQVWLNADSKISYNFDKCSREVELTGEAYFDVARDENCPFIIHTSMIDLKVLGTAFNVRSYADEEVTETSLIHGSVEITLLKSPDHKKIILKPNEKLTVRNVLPVADSNSDMARTDVPVMTLGKIRFKTKDSTALETMWTQYTLAFDEDPLEEVARRIERWYDVKVDLDEALRKKPFTADFHDKDLQTVLEALRYTGIRCELNNKELTLRP